jgi:hypothetical protein
MDLRDAGGASANLHTMRRKERTMAASTPGSTLLVTYLVGLGALLVGVALILVGVLEGRGLFTVLGGALAALGLLVVVLKIMARNRAG